ALREERIGDRSFELSCGGICRTQGDSSPFVVLSALREERIGDRGWHLHETLVARSPQQNGIVERRNRTLIEAAHTMLIYAQAPLFLWAEAVSTECFTQNRSIIRLRHGKTPYELMHVDDDSTGSPSSTTVDQDAPSPSKSLTPTKIQSSVILQDVRNDNLDIEVAHMGNDPLLGVPILEVTSEQSSSTASPQSNVQLNHPMTYHNSKWIKDHPLNYIIGPLSRPVSTRLQLHEQALFCYYDAFLTSVEPKTYKEALTQACWIEAMQEELHEFERLKVDIEVAHMGNDPLLGVPILEVTSEQSSSTASPQSNVQLNHPMTYHNSKWIKDHPLNYIIGPLSRPVSTRLQLHEQALF
nr:Gag-Pol polyprotein [Tanacetum cinerariifolium]